MIVSSFADRFSRFVSWLYWRQWAAWELLIAAVVALVLLLWVIRRRRTRRIRRIYENQARESSGVIGSNLSVRRRGGRLFDDLKKGRHSAKTEEPSDKLREEVKQLQREIIKRKQAEVRLERRVAQLTADNEKLRRRLAENEQVGEKPAQAATTEKRPRPEVSKVEQIEQKPKQRVTAEPAVEPLRRKFAGKSKTYAQRHRTVDGVKQKLCRTCKEWKAEGEFHKNSASRDGLAGACKECKINAAREYRKRRKAAKGQ